MKRVIWSLTVLGLLAFAQTVSAQDNGAKVFSAHGCSMCHSIAGKGNTKGPLDEVGSKLTPAEIRGWITDPAGSAAKARADRKPPMSAMQTKFKDLSKQDLDDLVAYLAAQKKKN